MKASPSPRRAPRKPLPAVLTGLVAAPAIPSRAEADTIRLTVLPVDSNVLEPHFSAGDYVMIAPTSTYRGCGLYVVQSESGARTILSVERSGDTKLRLTAGHDWTIVSRGAFNGIVVGKVVARVTPRDQALFRATFLS